MLNLSKQRMNNCYILLIISILALYIYKVNADCSMSNNCNGHGLCIGETSSCSCYDGWGAENDISTYKAADCSSRTCPSGNAWADVPTSSTEAHAPAECSNRGTCDHSSGLCKCFIGFTGAACQKNKCPNDCSGHGVCASIKQMARMDDALPLGYNTYYEGAADSSTWDEDQSYGCVCDSKWKVGLGAGETQEPEWFGADCSLRHCLSADDPRTDKNELDCENVTATDSIYKGKYGNLCQVDCANRGLCDYKTGLCSCFNGFFGSDCSIVDSMAVYELWKN